MSIALRLPPRLEHEQAPACMTTLVAGLRAVDGPSVTIDASALQQFDSSALAVLLTCRREALAAGKALQVQGMPDRLAGLSRLYGVDMLLAPSPAPVGQTP